MSSRLSNRLNMLRANGEKAMGIFFTSGFPHPSLTNHLLDAVDAGGADFIELGMPHSDPLAEGLPIQHSSTCALNAGATMQNTMEAVVQFRKRSETPLLLMGYINPILRFGVEQFCEQATLAGVDGLIIPDLPPGEFPLLRGHARKYNLNMVFLVAPNTSSERIQEIDRLSDGFVYCVSITGLTGTGVHGQVSAINAYLERASQVITKNPLLVGFGIQTQEDAKKLSEHTDGYIVGSAVIKEIENLWTNESLSSTERQRLLAQFVRTLKLPQSST